MNSILIDQNFEVELKRNPSAKEVSDFIIEKSKEMIKSDMFVLYFSGHGGTTFDQSGDEEDKIDEYWVLGNGSNMLDDSVRVLLSQFAKGVKILFLSDSCHSGSMYKSLPFFYVPEVTEKEFVADFIAITSSSDSETSLMGQPYSKFTNSLVNLWNNGAYDGNYLDFYRKLYEVNLEEIGRHVQYYSEGENIEYFQSSVPFVN